MQLARFSFHTSLVQPARWLAHTSRVQPARSLAHTSLVHPPLFASLLALLLGLTWAMPNVAAAQYTHRLTRVVYDFDNNGNPDADLNIGYDAAGFVVSTDYTYFGDGTEDLFNTEDDDTIQEDGVFVHDGNGLLFQVDLDRGTESFDNDVTFTNGRFDRIDSITRDAGGVVTSDVYFDFSYVGDDVVQIAGRQTSDNALINTLNLTYGTDGLPETYDLISAGVSIFNTLDFDTAGNFISVSSTASGGFGSGTGTLTYLPGSGQLETEVWTQTGFVGSLLSEFPGENYTKHYTYDGADLLLTEEVDIDSDSSVEAVLSFEWTLGTCNPSFQWAPNGQPNFSSMPSQPSMVPDAYVPGTGATYFRNCGPLPVPEPGFGSLIGAGGLALACFRAAAARRRLRA